MNIEQNINEMIPPPENIFPADEGFEIDPETLEIFSLEADDLLRNIGEQLKLLTQDPARYEALMEVRRSAHTLKGSAAIIGMKALS